MHRCFNNLCPSAEHTSDVNAFISSGRLRIEHASHVMV